MSESYAKLFSTITTSTVWSEPHATRIVWVTMLAISDRCGEVQASIPGLARVANVSLPECEAALATFLSPDAYSRTPEHEGRRIEVVRGGWRLLNHDYYRRKLDAEDRKERQARWVADKRASEKTKPKPDDKPADFAASSTGVDIDRQESTPPDKSIMSTHTALALDVAIEDQEKGGSPVGAPPSSEREVSKKKPKAKEQTLADWLASIGDADPIRPEDPIVVEMSTAGVPSEFQALAWSMFCDQFDDPKKRQADWRAHFRNAIRGNWVKAWFFDDATGECRLTTAGKQAQRVHQSQGVEQ